MNDSHELPPVPDVGSERVRERFLAMQREIEQLIDAAESLLRTEIEPGFRFQFTNSAPGAALLDPYEQGQVLSFVLRYRHLPELHGMQVEEVDGEYHVANIGEMRHVLNEYRSLIQNEKDSIHYRKIHNFCRKRLDLRDPTQGTVCTVHGSDGSDVTQAFLTLLGERVKAISMLQSALEFDYVYNGILQHSAMEFSERFVDDYTTGELNYLLAKHAHVLGFVKDLMSCHLVLVHSFFFPTMGAL